MILGLDVSTSIIGACIIESETEALETLEFINLKKEKSLFFKVLDFREHIEKYKAVGISRVAIEEPLVMYKPGFSSAQILQKLAMFNGMVALACFNVFDVVPEYYNVNHARKLAFPDMKYNILDEQGNKQDRKTIVWSHVAEKYPNVPWLYGPRSGKLVKSNFDMSDAAVVALAAARTKVEQ